MTAKRQQRATPVQKELRAKVSPDLHTYVMAECGRLGITYTTLVERVLGRDDLQKIYLETIQ